MDKVKLYLAMLLKYHFWVLSAVTLVVAVVGWFLATSTLADVYTAQTSKINSKFSTLRSITSVVHHPNETFEQGVDKLLNEPKVGLKARVLAAWNLAYNEQKDKVLKWPSDDADLGADFAEHVRDKTFNDEIDIPFRERYQNYVKQEFPRLLKIVDAQSHLEGGGGRRAGMLQQEEDEETEKAKEKHDYKVVWHADNQREIDEALDWQRPPTSKELFCLQENLWVYQALLQIIANVNAGAKGHYNANIKDIVVMSIARNAGIEFQNGMAGGKIYLPGSPPGATPAMPVAANTGNAPAAPPTMAPAPMPGALPAANPGATSGGGGRRRGGLDGSMGDLAGAAVQEEGRYVDGKGQPLAAGATAPPEFKRMPIYLQLYMDQREVSRLLAECANSPLPVEVRQLRINPAPLRGRNSKTTSPSRFASPKAGGAGPAPGRERTTDAAEQYLNPYDMPVEIYGIIYIFNPPDRAKLDVVGQEAAAGDASTGEAPAEAAKPAAGEPAAGETEQPAAEPAKPATAEDASETPARPAATTEEEAPATEPPATKPAVGDGEEATEEAAPPPRRPAAPRRPKPAPAEPETEEMAK